MPIVTAVKHPVRAGLADQTTLTPGSYGVDGLPETKYAANSHEGKTMTWQTAMKEAVRDPIRLCRMLNLPTDYEAAAVRAGESFPVFAPLGYIGRMKPGDPNDPLLRQVLPLAEELDDVAGFTTDPIDEEAARLTPGLLQKYSGRALMITIGACAIHCRYCFRRHYPYSEGPKSLEQWHPALQQIADDPMLEEILLSGGDPLTLVDETLVALIESFNEIPHLR